MKTNQRSYCNHLADFLWKVSLKILNSGLILKTFLHVFCYAKQLTMKAQIRMFLQIPQLPVQLEEVFYLQLSTMKIQNLQLVSAIIQPKTINCYLDGYGKSIWSKIICILVELLSM